MLCFLCLEFTNKHLTTALANGYNIIMYLYVLDSEATMSKKLKIWLLVIALLLILGGWVVHRQWNNITAVVDAIRYSNEEVETKLQENNQAIQEYLENEENISVREMTEEEVQGLLDGTLTEEEVVQRMTGQTTTSAAPNSTPSQTPASTPQQTAGQTVAKAIARLYITKSDYLGRLDAIEAQVRAEYIALSKEEKKGAKQRFLAQYLPTVAAWESECDAAVYGVITEVREALKQSGQSETVADQIEASYLNEKRLKKSYFINRYMD